MGLFGGRGKPDHPLADPKEAKRLLGDLSRGDPYQSLAEINHWVESVAAAEGFRHDERASLILLLDESGQTPARKLLREYFGNTRLPKQQESKLWSASLDFWKQLSLAYQQSIDSSIDGEKGSDTLKNLLPQLGVRTMRALGSQLKWLQMRY